MVVKTWKCSLLYVFTLDLRNNCKIGIGFQMKTIEQLFATLFLILELTVLEYVKVVKKNIIHNPLQTIW